MYSLIATCFDGSGLGLLAPSVNQCTLVRSHCSHVVLTTVVVVDALEVAVLVDPDVVVALVDVAEFVPLETTITTMPSLSLYCLMTVSFATVDEASVI